MLSPAAHLTPTRAGDAAPSLQTVAGRGRSREPTQNGFYLDKLVLFAGLLSFSMVIIITF
jgi:hypothetical protein